MGQKTVHRLIAETAKEIAAAAYEDLVRDDMFYRAWPRQRHFVIKKWATFIPAARDSLIEILKGNHPQPMKDEIMEALLLDRSLPN